MWKKIKTEIQIDQLHQGDIIIKYPINGESVEEIDFDDVKRLNRYEISKLTQRQEKYFEYELSADNLPVVNINSREFKEEKKWWLEVV
jgi:hypothetical protein